MKIPVLFHASNSNPLAEAVRGAIAADDEDGAYLLTWRLAHYARAFRWEEHEEQTYAGARR